jgi:hypothetical protein
MRFQTSAGYEKRAGGKARRGPALQKLNPSPLISAIPPPAQVFAAPARAGTSVAPNFSARIIAKGRALCATATTGSAGMNLTTGLMK